MLPGAFDSYASAINNHNEVAGEMRFNQGSDSVAVIWRDGQIVQLPSLFTGPYSRASATGINDGGQAVGQNSGLLGNSTAVLWENGMVYDLNDLIRADDPLRPFVRIQLSIAINNRGQILVHGEDSRLPFKRKVFRLTPSGQL